MTEVYLEESEIAIFDLYFAGLCHIKHHPRNVSETTGLPIPVYEGLALEAYKMIVVRRQMLGMDVTAASTP